MQKWRIWLLVLFFGVALSTTLAAAQFLLFPNFRIGKTAPDFKLKTITGKDAAFSAVRAGGNTVLFFWTTWCPNCSREIAALDEKINKLKADNIQMVLVDVGEESRLVAKYAAERKLPPEILLDEDGAVSTQYGVVGIPTYVFIDKKGVIRGIENVFPEDYQAFFRPS
ncbi:MAG: TlpA family protein disulfide reductase [Candidatus Omnitrophica bacterium]|nr:TlpA family protein disulfide reductase [Candidatus Omnitrophota bacterium]